jgi:hypothetical protein
VNAVTQPITIHASTPILPTALPSSPPTHPAPHQRVSSPLPSYTPSATQIRPSNTPPLTVHFAPIAPNNRPARPTSPVSHYTQRIAELELELQEALVYHNAIESPQADPNATPHPNAILITPPNPNITPTPTPTSAPTYIGPRGRWFTTPPHPTPAFSLIHSHVPPTPSLHHIPPINQIHIRQWSHRHNHSSLRFPHSHRLHALRRLHLQPPL